MLADGRIRVTAIQRLCVHDGPGVRTVVFLKGCYLQCPWCCNPETICYEEDGLYDKGTCRPDKGSAICKDCVLTGGGRDKEECPIHSFEKTYVDYGEDELFALLMRDKRLYDSGGGVTFSGGEPLYQAAPLSRLLQRLKTAGVHVAIETSLYAPEPNLLWVKPCIDYWIIDLKYQYGYIPQADVDIEAIDVERNLAAVQSSVRPEAVWYRMVIMGEVLNRFDAIIEALKKRRVGQLELLAYHSLGKNKYLELEKHFHPFACVEKEELERCVALLYENGINASYLTV